jgi:hypothetical protein
MYFDLLEQLVAHQPAAENLALTCLDRDRESLYKTFFAFAAHHDPRDVQNANALVITSAVVSELSGSADRLDPRRLTEHFVRYLLHIPIVSRDSATLKPDRSSLNVVSVLDVEEAFEAESLEHLYRVTRDMLGIMDNRQYFFEILTSVALQRSASSITFMHSAWHAVEILGWTNHFTPFVILQTLDVLFLDPDRVSPGEETPCNRSTFLAFQDRINSITGLQQFSALFGLFQKTHLLKKRILPMIARRLFDLTDDDNWSVTSWQDVVCVRAAAARLTDFPDLVSRAAKIHFNF